MQTLAGIDSSLFLFLNHLPHNFITDIFFAGISLAGTSGAVWFVILALLFLREEITEKKIFLALAVAGLVSFILVEGILKPVAGRPRPEFTLAGVIVVSDHTVSPSFPSGHATIAFAAAMILSYAHRKWAGLYYLLAVLISFSRIYIGKHYPSDVLAGTLLGSVIGYISLETINVTYKSLKISSGKKNKRHGKH